MSGATCNHTGPHHTNGHAAGDQGTRTRLVEIGRRVYAERKEHTAQLQRQLGERDAALAALHAECISLRDALPQREQEAASLRSHLEVGQRELQVLRQQLQDRDAALHTLRAEVTALRDAAALGGHYLPDHGLEDTLARKVEELSLVTMRLEQHQSELTSLQGRLKQEREMKEKYQKYAEERDAIIEALSARTTATDEQCRQLVEQLQQRDASLVDLQSQLLAARAGAPASTPRASSPTPASVPPASISGTADHVQRLEAELVALREQLDRGRQELAAVRATAQQEVEQKELFRRAVEDRDMHIRALVAARPATATGAETGVPLPPAPSGPVPEAVGPTVREQHEAFMPPMLTAEEISAVHTSSDPLSPSAPRRPPLLPRPSGRFSTSHGPAPRTLFSVLIIQSFVSFFTGKPVNWATRPKEHVDL